MGMAYFYTQKVKLCICGFILAVLLAVSGCERNDTAPVKQVPIANVSYVQLFTLTASADEEHPVLVETGGDQIWYRSKDPVLNLRHLNLADTAIAALRAGEGYGVRLIIKNEHRDYIANWTNEHIGERLGVFVGGNLIYSDLMKTRLSHEIVFWGFNSQAEAIAAADTIRQGGKRDKPDDAKPEP